MKRTHLIYVLHCNGYYKVGFAFDIQKRIQALMIGNPMPIEVVNSFMVESLSCAQRFEREIHVRLKTLGLHHHGEWFISSDEVLKVCADVCNVETSKNLKLKFELQRMKRVKVENCKHFSNKEQHIKQSMLIPQKLQDRNLKEVARRTGINVLSLYRLARGKTKKPHASTLLVLEKYFEQN